MDEFQLSASDVIRERISDQAGEADRYGERLRFLASLRIVFDRLALDPISYGEELFDLKHSGLAIRLGVHWPAAVEYCVHPEQRLVVLRRVAYCRPPGSSGPIPEDNGR